MASFFTLARPTPVCLNRNSWILTCFCIQSFTCLGYHSECSLSASERARAKLTMSSYTMMNIVLTHRKHSGSNPRCQHYALRIDGWTEVFTGSLLSPGIHPAPSPASSVSQQEARVTLTLTARPVNTEPVALLWKVLVWSSCRRPL